MLDIAAGAAQDSAGNPNVVTEQCSHRRGHCGSDSKDSDGYKVVNCTRAQPVFHRFGRLARGKVISVTVLTINSDKSAPRSRSLSNASPGKRRACTLCGPAAVPSCGI